MYVEGNVGFKNQRKIDKVAGGELGRKEGRGGPKEGPIIQLTQKF